MKDNAPTKFFIPCVPPKSTHQASLRIMQKKNGGRFIGKFASSKGKAVQDELLILLREFVPPCPYSVALRVSVEWTYPWRKSETKKNRAEGYLPCTTRPDADNLCKLLFDCMTRLGYWTDDSVIADLRFQKAWGDKPGIGITIEEI